MREYGFILFDLTGDRGPLQSISSQTFKSPGDAPPLRKYSRIPEMDSTCSFFGSWNSRPDL